MGKIHYGWAVSLCGMLLMMCTNGFPSNVFASCLPYLKDLGYSGTSVSLLVTVRCAAVFVGMSMVPALYKRVSTRAGLAISCGLLGIAFFCHGAAWNYWGYLLGAVIMGIGYGLGGMIPISILINRWFVKMHATALAICCVGTGVSAMVFPPLIVYVAEHRSLTAAFRMIALVSLAVMLLVILIVRDTPEERNLQAFGAGTETEAGAAGRTKQQKRHNLPGWMRSLMLVALVMLGGVAMSATTHYAALFTSVGYSKEAAAASVSVLGICLMASKPVFGWVTDRWGGKCASGIFLLALILGSISCCLSQTSPIFMYGGTALMGLGFAPASVGVSIYAEDFSTEDYYPVLLKNFQRAHALGGIVFSAVPGKLYDLFGNYVISYWMFTAMLAAFSVVLFAAYHRAEKQLGAASPDQESSS